jgi:hypothetical protein
VTIDVKFSESGQSFNPQFKELQIVKEYVGGEEYDGAYEVTPKFVAQTLPTAEKLMTKDLTIEEIPYAEVSNNSGGKTVIIG